MFSNQLIRNLCSTSDEGNLKLSRIDWKRIINANSEFTESSGTWRGNIHWGRYILKKIGKEKIAMDDEDLLELCCGTGYLFFSFKALLKNRSAYYSDISNSQLRAFSQRCQLANIPQPNMIECDISSLPFQDETFNLLFGNSFLHHLPDVGFYLSEFYRVLKTSGTLVAFHEPTTTSLFWERFPWSLIKKPDGVSLTDIWLIRPEIITKLLHEVGFTKVRIYPSRLLSSIFVEPFFHILKYLKIMPYTGLEAEMMKICDTLERSLFQSKFMEKYCPSIAIVAKKET